MAERKQYVGDAAIGRAIKSLKGALEGLNGRVQDIACSIIVHAAGAGNGDMSRALELVKLVKRHKTLNASFLIGYFRYFGNANVNLAANEGKGKVSLLSKDAKAYRGGFDVDGARANNWYDAIDDEGNRAAWYAGPMPEDFKPFTIGDVAAKMQRFAEQTGKALSDTKDVKGKTVPVYDLSDADRSQVEHALAFLQRIANTLARHEDIARLTAEAEAAKAAAKQDEEVLEVIEPKEKAVA